MGKYYGLVALGKSFAIPNGRRFEGINVFMETEAKDRVEAFVTFYSQLADGENDIAALKLEDQNYLLGFSEEEWGRLATKNVIVREGLPIGSGAQIQAIRDQPFY